jgi:hypothetical protein
MISTEPADLIFTVAVAFGKHALAPAETTILNSDESESDANSGAAVKKAPSDPVMVRYSNR